MRTRKLEVNKLLLGDFFRKVDKNELDATLLAVSKDGDSLLVGINYESNERELITELEELIEDFNEEESDDEETEEEDDNEQ